MSGACLQLNTYSFRCYFVVGKNNCTAALTFAMQTSTSVAVSTMQRHQDRLQQGTFEQPHVPGKCTPLLQPLPKRKWKRQNQSCSRATPGQPRLCSPQHDKAGGYLQQDASGAAKASQVEQVVLQHLQSLIHMHAMQVYLQPQNPSNMRQQALQRAAP